MPGLRELQAAFHARVLGAATTIDTSIRADRRAGAGERLGIYVDAYRLRLREVLAKDYPVLAACLGEDDFGELAHAYLAAHPSHHPSVRWFGSALADFLARTPPWRERTALAELARFEWTQGEVCDARDAEPVAGEAVAAVAPERWPAMRFALRPAVRLLDLTCNAAAAVRSYNETGAAPALQCLPRPGTWLLWRGTDMMVRWRVLENDEREALAALAAGERFGEICARVAEHAGADQAGLRAASLLKQWLSDEL
ncbi:MAG: DNA-binding domain-containing protein, partial [Gammaproteobacteria bacterium]|nr:DNA-binding domain-containing protein [Gammaproteobacteria bacterium]